jgi:hypothetical protein
VAAALRSSIDAGCTSPTSCGQLIAVPLASSEGAGKHIGQRCMPAIACPAEDMGCIPSREAAWQLAPFIASSQATWPTDAKHELPSTRTARSTGKMALNRMGLF